MNPTVSKIVALALTGAVSAFVVDLDAWQEARKAKEDAKFDWELAASRWLRCAIIGAMGGAGWSVTS